MFFVHPQHVDVPSLHSWYGGQTHVPELELDELELDELDNEPPAPPPPDELALELPDALDEVALPPPAPPPDELELELAVEFIDDDELDDDEVAPENSSPSPPQPAMANATSAAEPHRVNEIITFSPFYPDEPGAPAETRNMPVVESQSLPVCTWPSFHTGW